VKPLGGRSLKVQDSAGGAIIVPKAVESSVAGLCQGRGRFEYVQVAVDHVAIDGSRWPGRCEDRPRWRGNGEEESCVSVER
jgi:hypothetical protein